MLATEGPSLLTALALVAGLVCHGLKQFRTARAAGSGITVADYVTAHWPETSTAIIAATVLWAGLPELAGVMPDAARSLGVGDHVGILSSFACGFVGNSLADFIGGRAKALTGS